MANDRKSWMMRTVEPTLLERRPDALAHWYSFLEKECLKENGLLCFYDRHKFPEVAYFCGLLAECLMTSPEKGKKAPVERVPDIHAILEQAEKAFTPRKHGKKA